MTTFLYKNFLEDKRVYHLNVAYLSALAGERQEKIVNGRGRSYPRVSPLANGLGRDSGHFYFFSEAGTALNFCFFFFKKKEANIGLIATIASQPISP
jgi:hypothetical protein